MEQLRAPIGFSSQISRFAMALLAVCGALTALTLAGCSGGSGGSPAATGRTQQPTGTAVFSINWPKPAAMVGRLIPLATQSIDLRLTSADGKSLYGDTLLVRPAGGGPASATFNNVPVGIATLAATAYPNADGSGVALASAQTPVTVVANQNTAVSLTMMSTIKTLTVTPATATLKTAQTETVMATATDASGNVVLFTSSTLTWASSAPGTASVDVTGKVTAVAAGTATITATETESGVSGTASVTVSNAPPAAKTISFAAPVSYTTPAPADMIAADLDGDGNADIAVLSGGNVVVFWGHGDGTFDPGAIVYTGVGDNPAPRAAVDMNGDGKLDIVCSCQSSTVYVLNNTGGRTFSNVTTIPIPGGTHPMDLAVGDFDGDGKPDIAPIMERSSNGGSGFIAIVKNNGSSNYTVGQTIGVGSYGEGIVAGDINGDGKIDLVASYIGSGGVNQVYIGNGNDTFTAGSSYTTASANIPILILADFNQDGKVDLGVDDYFDNNMGVLFGNGNGTFQPVTQYSAAPYPLVWQAVDLDGDGYPDIVAPNAGSGNFTVLHNQGNGLFGAAVQFSSGGQNTRTSATADFNKDGRPDLVFGCESSNSIQILINTSK